MNVVIISRVRMNPYTRLLASALEAAAPGLHCAHEEALSPATVRRWRGKAAVFHVHWAELLYHSPRAGRAGLKLAALLLALLQARRAGIALVYTAHNVAPHETAHPALDRLADAVLYRLVDAVHVHDDESRQEVLTRHPRRVAVIPHGNYIGAYPDACTRVEARRQLAIADTTLVYLALGRIRPYKGLDDLICAFRQLPGEDLTLLIAGHPHDPAYGASLRALAAHDRRIHLHLHYVPDDQVQVYLRASDVCVLPYRSATTSGVAILAFSFACPVIAPDMGPFRSLVASGSGILYPPGAHGLRDALASARHCATEEARAAALAVARSLDWGPLARQHLALYQELAHS